MRSAFACLLLLAGTAPAEESPTVAEMLKDTPGLRKFAEGLEREGLLAMLGEPGPFTVLAPTDAALEGKRLDRDLLARHLFAGRRTAAEALEAKGMRNATGDTIEFAVSGESTRAGGVRIAKADLPARNGVVHMIDGVLPIPIRVEAALPEGFPAPGPAGEVTLKDYPRYRAARVAGGRESFWTLFGHIKRNDIAMTAPVEMSLSEEDGRLAIADMAFLYGTPEMGEKGREGRVEVEDLGPARVLSFGFFGEPTGELVEEARRAIEERLKRDGFVTKGSWRLLGYNSPMVPAGRRFHEIQVPVAARP
jgi:Fasciclin domain/SOUL heme-binding protein